VVEILTLSVSSFRWEILHYFAKCHIIIGTDIILYMVLYIYSIPISHNGVVNGSFNVCDYLTSAAVSSAVKIFNDGRYLRNSGIVVSSASTTFNNSVNINGILYLANAKVSGTLTVSSDSSFNNVNIGGTTTLGTLNAGSIACNSVACGSIDVSGLFQAHQSSDSLNLTRAFAATMTFSMTNDGMVFYLPSTSITQSMLHFSEIPTTAQRSPKGLLSLCQAPPYLPII
jgi:hypothetical protein